jgi:hypothetical protein
MAVCYWGWISNKMIDKVAPPKVHMKSLAVTFKFPLLKSGARRD